MKRAFQTLLLLSLVVSGCGGAARLSHDEIRKQIADIGTSTLVPKSIEVRRVVNQSGNRAIAETTVELAFQFERDTPVSPWHIAAVRLGDRDWLSLEELIKAVTESRRRETATALQKLADGIANYRQRNGGSPPKAADIVALTDVLHPQYMSDLVRVDSWGQPIQYEPEANGFRLRSVGSDGVRGTADDILFPE